MADPRKLTQAELDAWSAHTTWGDRVRRRGERVAREAAKQAARAVKPEKVQVDTPASDPVKGQIIRRPFKVRKVRRKR